MPSTITARLEVRRGRKRRSRGPSSSQPVSAARTAPPPAAARGKAGRAPGISCTGRCKHLSGLAPVHQQHPQVGHRDRRSAAISPVEHRADASRGRARRGSRLSMRVVAVQQRAVLWARHPGRSGRPARARRAQGRGAHPACLQLAMPAARPGAPVVALRAAQAAKAGALVVEQVAGGGQRPNQAWCRRRRPARPVRSTSAGAPQDAGRARAPSRRRARRSHARPRTSPAPSAWGNIRRRRDPSARGTRGSCCGRSAAGAPSGGPAQDPLPLTRSAGGRLRFRAPAGDDLGVELPRLRDQIRDCSPRPQAGPGPARGRICARPLVLRRGGPARRRPSDLAAGRCVCPFAQHRHGRAHLLPPEARRSASPGAPAVKSKLVAMPTDSPLVDRARLLALTAICGITLGSARRPAVALARGGAGPLRPSVTSPMRSASCASIQSPVSR